MELKLIRKYKGDRYTIGDLFINDTFFCNVIEDKVRELRTPEDKVYGKTAIPAGRYEVILTYSPHFKRILPELIDVAFFKNIRIHAGNTEEDSRGCLIVGINDDVKVGWVHDSRKTLDRLMQILTSTNEKIFITVV